MRASPPLSRWLAAGFAVTATLAGCIASPPPLPASTSDGSMRYLSPRSRPGFSDPAELSSVSPIPSSTLPQFDRAVVDRTAEPGHPGLQPGVPWPALRFSNRPSRARAGPYGAPLDTFYATR